jgi:DNA-binding HxlR family transcriptional regulator
MTKTRYNAYAAMCPTRQALDRIADKWTVLIVGLLGRRPHRFGELLRAVDGVSQKMLTQTLRSLELDGLVHRHAKPTVPVTVEYSLTAAGRTLIEPLEAIRIWAERHIGGVLAARSRQVETARRSRARDEEARKAGVPLTVK